MQLISNSFNSILVQAQSAPTIASGIQEISSIPTLIYTLRNYFIAAVVVGVFVLAAKGIFDILKEFWGGKNIKNETNQTSVVSKWLIIIGICLILISGYLFFTSNNFANTFAIINSIGELYRVTFGGQGSDKINSIIGK